jgi:Mn-dependent DtxR family transcriptional regulator
MKKPTKTQARYLAFIHYYTKVHRVPPAEFDMQMYFRVSPPSVHQMVVTLEANGFIERIPGQARTIRVLLPLEEIPDLE